MGHAAGWFLTTRLRIAVSSMAWKARVAKKTTDQPAGVFTLDIEFFDDADPAAVISRKPLSLPYGVTLAEIQTIVKAEGAVERAKFNALQNLDSKIGVGAEISI